MTLRRQHRRRALLRQQLRPLRLLDLHRGGKGQFHRLAHCRRHEDLLPLSDFRNRLKSVSEDPECRSKIRRNGQSGLGPLTFDARRMLLDELLTIQTETGMELISSLEVRLVREQWAVDRTEESLRKIERILSPSRHESAKAVA